MHALHVSVRVPTLPRIAAFEELGVWRLLVTANQDELASFCDDLIGPLRSVDIRGGGRLSGKLGAGWNVGLLDIQVDDVKDVDGNIVGPANNFGVIRLQREVGRSSYGAIFVNRKGYGQKATPDDWNRSYGADANLQLSGNQRLSLFFARTDTPETRKVGPKGSDYSGRAFYNFTNNQIGRAHV